MRKFVANMKIRTSLLGVLGFFSLMLVIGAMLGVLSLRVSNGTLAGIRQTQDVGDALTRLVNSYKDVVNGLARTANAHYGDIVRSAGQSVALAPGLAAEAAGLMQRASAAMNRAQTEFEYYKGLPRPDGAQESLAEVDAAYAALMHQGIAPLFGLLERGDMAAYQKQAQTLHDAVEGRFARAVEGFDFWRASQLQDAYVLATQRYQGVLAAVAVGGAMAALLVLGTYLFLRRRVLLPLQEAGQHFDRMAAGDLTARVEVRNSNEVGQLFGALKRMQENLARTVSQVRRGV
ncbi:Tar ligand binding domain-containing protein, partial [Bordetella sp. BOR01]|uniref:Tar ligand binding domain-containing protein n=1 Tax=Bordetella sp. BOR01 TaxID=2854779 RepID=UPI001C444C65